MPTACESEDVTVEMLAHNIRLSFDGYWNSFHRCALSVNSVNITVSKHERE